MSYTNLIDDLPLRHKEHISKVRSVFSEDIVKEMGVKSVAPNDLIEIAASFDKTLATESLSSFRNVVTSTCKNSIDIDFKSLDSYLLLLDNNVIMSSPIAIDNNTGKIVVFHNNTENSVSVVIQCNSSEEYVFSTIGRGDGLAKFKGKASFTKDSHYKVFNLLSVL